MRALAVIAFVGIWGFFGTVAGHLASGHLISNFSPSMAEGFYWVSRGEVIHRGDVVLACAPERFERWAVQEGLLTSGPCGPENGELLLKRAVAVAGDRVRITQAGVFVNGQRLTESERNVERDDGKLCSRVAPVPAIGGLDRVLRSGEMELLGDNREHSFDGRYWGPTNRIFGRAELAFQI